MVSWQLSFIALDEWYFTWSYFPLRSFHDDEVNNFLDMLEIGSQVGCS